MNIVINLTLNQAIGTVIDSNSIVEIWVDCEYDSHLRKSLWRGMAHSIPEELLKLTNWQVFSALCENIEDSKVINIKIVNE